MYVTLRLKSEAQVTVVTKIFLPV